MESIQTSQLYTTYGQGSQYTEAIFKHTSESLRVLCASAPHESSWPVNVRQLEIYGKSELLGATPHSKLLSGGPSGTGDNGVWVK